MEPHVWVRGMERHGMHQADAMDHPCGAVVPLRGGPASSLRGRLDRLEQQGMIAVFDPEQRAKPVGRQRLEGGRSGTQTVCGHDPLAVRVGRAQRGKEACGGVTCTILFARAL
jgi:hypothetical protein